jgi:hypothetical protein
MAGYKSRHRRRRKMNQYFTEQIARDRAEQMRKRADRYRMTHCDGCRTRPSAIRRTLARVLGRVS